MCLCSKDDFEQPKELMLLWTHEVLRVFYDRLIDSDDQTWFLEQIKELCTAHFDVEFSSLFTSCGMTVKGVGGEIDDDDVRTLMYNTFADPKAKKKTYRRTGEWCGGIPALQKATEGYLEDYNAVSPKPMKLVLFLFAIEHVCRIARVLQMPRGNVLLAGVGGSGRQSVTRLASHICDMEVFQIEVSKSYSMVDWREDLKKVLREAGTRLGHAPKPTPHTPHPPLRCCARRGRRRRRRSSSSPIRRSSRRRTSRTSTAC